MKMKRILYGGVLFLLMIAAIVCHSGVQLDVLEAGKRCVLILIPSLYLFSILAACCVRSGFLESFAGKKLCGVDGYLLAVILFSQVGGYPVGAQLLHTMRTDGIISAEQERRLLCICMGCGPGFLLGTVCSRFPLSVGLGMMLSVTLPNILLIWYLAGDLRLQRIGSRSVSGALLVTESVESAASAMLKICGMVIGLAAVLGIMEEMRLFNWVSGVLPFPQESTTAFLKTLAEVSCITEYLQNGGSLPLAAALLSFGGICVHLQLAAICEGNLHWCSFWVIRLLCSAMTYGICRIGMFFLFPDVVSVAVLEQNHAAVYEGSAVPGLCLLLMSLMLLAKHSKSRKNF